MREQSTAGRDHADTHGEDRRPSARQPECSARSRDLMVDLGSEINDLESVVVHYDSLARTPCKTSAGLSSTTHHRGSFGHWEGTKRGGDGLA
jgi:hypothetical protein